MKSGLQAYFDLIYREFDCYATWLPGTGVAVGDIGRIAMSGSFLRTGSLSERAQLPRIREEAEPDQNISTRGGVTFSAGASVEANQVVHMLAKAGASLDISFGRATAAALVLQNVIRREFADEQPVRALMKSMLATGGLDPDEVVVTYVKQASSGVVATTYDAQQGADIKIDAALGGGALTIANVGGYLKVVSQRSSQTVVSAEPGKPLTPVYRALVFRHNRHWWSFWRSWLDVQSVIPTRNFFDAPEPDAILADRPSLAIPDGEADDD